MSRPPLPHPVTSEPVPLPPAELEAATALHHLSQALLGHDVPAELTADVTRLVTALTRRIESAPSRTKQEAYARYRGHQRIEHFLTHGRWPDPPPDGAPLTFDVLSFVGGALNPASAGVRYHRDGDGAVGRVTFGPIHEGPPGRAHGGIVAAVFDEVMGAVFRVTADSSSFTGSLSVRFEGPALLGQPLEFRARRVAIDGRKHLVEGTGRGPDGQFASATGTFIEMTPDHLARAVAPTPE